MPWRGIVLAPQVATQSGDKLYGLAQLHGRFNVFVYGVGTCYVHLSKRKSPFLCPEVILDNSLNSF
jgi:hypothetical protein